MKSILDSPPSHSLFELWMRRKENWESQKCSSMIFSIPIQFSMRNKVYLHLQHNLILFSGEYVAQFKFTVLVLPSQTLRITSHPLPYVKSDFEITDEGTKAILASSTKRTKKKKASKKKTNQTGTEEPMDTDQ